MTCTHHYILEPPNGTPSIEGTCKKCGERKVFTNKAWEERQKKERNPDGSGKFPPIVLTRRPKDA